jgi:hypothetical protein
MFAKAIRNDVDGPPNRMSAAYAKDALRRLGDRQRDRVVVVGHSGQWRRVAGLDQREVLAQVLADTEGPVTGAGEDDRAYARVGRQLRQSRLECFLQLAVERVHCLGAVENYRGDGLGNVDGERVRHGLPSWHGGVLPSRDTTCDAPAAPPRFGSEGCHAGE